MLTERDRLILDKLIEGKHDKAIGRDLGLSETTVRGAIRLICAKLDAPGRLPAAVKYAAGRKDRA